MAAKKTKKVLRISAIPEKGFWRAGIKHTAAPVDHPIDKFTKAQLEALRAERMLRVEEVDVPADDDAEGAQPNT